MAYSAPAIAEQKTNTGDDHETHAWLKGCFESSEEMTVNSRALAERDRDYHDLKQLTTDEIRVLKLRGQPPITRPFIKRKISYSVGLEIKKRSDPKAYPRTPKHEHDADGATQALRYAADRVNFKKIKTSTAKELFIEGGPTGCYIGVEKKANRVEVMVTRVAWDRAFVDPHSAEADYSDAEYKGFITWMDEDKAKAKFPETSDVIARTIETASSSSTTYNDRPRSRKWVDAKRKRVRVIEIYWNDAQSGWMCATLTEGGFLKAPHVSIFVDQYREPECPLEFVSANVDRDNNRFGEVRELIDTQDSLNKRIQKLTHLLNVRQARFGRGVKDPDKQSSELAKPDGKIIADRDEFDIIPNADLAAGNFQILQLDIAESMAAGANASLMGKGPEGASGRAILANQQGGQVELEPLMDELAFWELRVYRQIWNRIRQYWTGEIWIRVTDDERNLRWVGLNKPMTNAEYAEQQKVPPEQFQQMVQQGMNPDGPAIDPQTGQQVIGNNLAELEVDIILDRGPDTVTLEQEQFDTLSKVQGIPPDMLIEVSSLRNKDKILKRIRGEEGPDGKPAEPPPPPPEVIKAQADAAEKQKDREFQTAKAVGDREIETLKIEKQAEKDKRTDELSNRKLDLEAQRHAHEIAALEHTRMQASRSMVPSRGQSGAKPHGQSPQQDLFSTAITIEMPPDVANALLVQSEAVTRSQISAAQAEELASNAEVETQASIPQLLQAMVQQSAEQMNVLMMLAKVIAAPKRLVKTSTGEKIVMPMLDAMNETVV